MAMETLGGSLPAGRAALAEIEAIDGHAVAVAGDVRDETLAKTLVDTAVGRFGGLDIGFNNAGSLGEMGPVSGVSLAGWRDTLDTNLTSAFLGAKYQVPALIERGGGSLIFTSSFVGYTVGMPGMAAYAASKAGLIGLTQVLAAEFGAKGVRANAILPGGTDTPASITNAPDATPEVLAFVESLHALKRMARSEEIARSVRCSGRDRCPRLEFGSRTFPVVSRMELRQLRYFVVAAEEEHFGRAARRLRIAQPALSRQIQHLEEELRVELFTRLPRGVRLSATGRALLEDARAVMASLERAIEHAQRVERGETGRLRVGYTDTITGGAAFGRIIRAYRREYPDVHLDLRLLSTLDQWEALRDNHIDVGFVFYRPPESEVEAIAIGREAVLLALPDKHPLARARSLRLSDLVREPFVWFSRAAAPLYHDQITRACAAGGLTLQVTQEANSNAARLDLVAAGVGATWSLGSSVSRIPKGVAVRSVEDFDESVTAYVIWRRDRLGPTGRAFLALVPAD